MKQFIILLLLIISCGPGKQSSPPIRNLNYVETNPNQTNTNSYGLLPCNIVDTFDIIPMTLDTAGTPAFLSTKDSLTLSWSPVTNLVDTICAYQIMYAHKKDHIWRFFKNTRYNIIPVSPNPSIVVYYSDVDTSEPYFFFGVRCRTMDGIKSDLHTSCDSTAASKGYTLWKKKD
jgi:hypothetical protein